MEGVESKLERLAGTTPLSDHEQKEGISKLTQMMCPRVNTTGTFGMDQRCTSTKVFAELGVTLDIYKSPQVIQKETKGIRGTLRYDKKTMDDYHTYQRHLLKMLSDQGRLSADIICNSEDGYLEKAGKKLSSADFCNTVDEITLDYLKFRTDAPNSTLETFRDVFACCAKIVACREAASLAVANDMMTDKEYRQWRKHMHVIISFATLMLVLEIFSLRTWEVSLIQPYIDRNPKTPANVERNSKERAAFPWRLLYFCLDAMYSLYEIYMYNI